MVATAWGTRHGGVNSFATDFCTGLARLLPSHRVACIVLEATAKDVEQAGSHRVALYCVGRAAETPDEWARQVSKLLEADRGVRFEWWLGHDVITGELAAACAKACRGSRLALIMHMSYADYGYAKHSIDEGPAIAQKSRSQRDLLFNADHAFAVGPLLYERLKEIRGRDETRSTMLVPGLIDKAPPLESSRLHAVTVGRFDTTETFAKQAPLAVASFARAVRAGIESSIREMREASLTVVGADIETGRHLRDLAEREAGRVVNLRILEFIEARDQLLDILSHANLFLMLSWHEGFGLGAWEGIGAGIPVIVTRNSGVYQLLDSVGGAAVGCIRHIDVHGQADGTPHSDDVEAVKHLILEVAADIPKSQANAESLRILLRSQCRYTWDAAVVQACHALGIAIASTLLDTPIPGVPSEPGEVRDGLAVAAAQRALDLSDTYFHNGQYGEALSALSPIQETARTTHLPWSLLVDATIMECEIQMRMNEYTRARQLAGAAAREAGDRKDWNRYVRARGVENVVLRDLGLYGDAVDLGLHLVDTAAKLAPDLLESAHRKAGRALALAGRWDEALRHGDCALELAQARSNRDDEAKARLVLGEAHRHGLNQAAAIQEYGLGRDLSGRAGNVDCYLWCVLGLADSLFLLAQYEEAEDVLHSIERYIKSTTQHYPLETLHLQLSLAAVSQARGLDCATELKDLAEKYDDLGVHWARDYVDGIIGRDFSHPKRF